MTKQNIYSLYGQYVWKFSKINSMVNIPEHKLLLWPNYHHWEPQETCQSSSAIATHPTSGELNFTIIQWMESLWRTGGALPVQLPPRHISSSAPEHGRTGRMEQHRPLLGSGLPPQNRACRAFSLPREADTLSHQVPKDPGRGWPPVHGALRAIFKSFWR